MILYNVTVKVDHGVHDEWLSWMQDTHIPEVLETGLFVDHKMCRLLSVDEEDGVTYAMQYFCESIQHFQEYQEKHARKLQGDSRQKFGDRTVAFRTLMEVI